MSAPVSPPPAPTGVASLVGPRGSANSFDPLSVTACRATAWRIALGLVAGLVLGVDIVLGCLVEQLLKASPADDLVVSGLLHAGWSPARGAFFDLGPGGIAVVVGCVFLGAACGWALPAHRAKVGNTVGVGRG